MASTQIQTTTQIRGCLNGPGAPGPIAVAGSRLWSVIDGGTDATNPDQCLWYSDDSGATWTKLGLVVADGSVGSMVAYNDAGTWRLHICSGATTATTTPLHFKSLHTNVNTGVPGSLTADATPDAGGANAGCGYPTLVVTPTATRARVWAIYNRITGASSSELRVGYALKGTSPDTAANWAFLSGLSGPGTSVDRHFGMGAYWTVGGADKLTIVFTDDSNPGRLLSYTFDPTAVTPALGSATVIRTLSSGQYPSGSFGRFHTLAATADYLVLATMNPDTLNIDLYKTTDGTTWTQPSGWAGITGGCPQVVFDGSNFQLIHTDTYTSDSIASVGNLKQKLITKATDGIGSANAFSDTQAQFGSCAVVGSNVGSTYRAGTSSPYSVRYDAAALLAPAGGGGSTGRLMLTGVG